MRRDETELLEGILVCEMVGVREHGEGYPVELRRDAKTGRLLVTAFNEGGNNITRVDLCDLVDWLSVGPLAGRVGDGAFVFPAPQK